MIKRINKVIKNPYFFSVIARIIVVIVGFLFTIFQSRYLGAEIKGQVATVNSMVSITAVVFGFGIYYAYPYYKRNCDIDIMPIFMSISLLFLVVYVSISAVALLCMKLSAKYIALLIITPLLVYDRIVSYITLIEIPNKRNATDIAVVTAELLMIIILWLTAKPSFVIGVIIIAAKDVVKAAFFTFLWRKRLRTTIDNLRVWLPRVVRFGIFPMFSLLMTTLNYRVDVLMLNGRVTDAAIGVYSVGVLLAERLWMIPDAMKGVMVSNITKGKDARETAYVIRICNTLSLLLVMGIVLLGKPFLDFAFGSEYNGSYQVTLILLAGVFSMIYYKLIASYNIAMGKQIVSFALLSVGVVCNVIANLILIPIMNIYGAGLASVISYAVCSVLFILYFCRETGIPFVEMLFINKDDYSKIKMKLLKK